MDNSKYEALKLENQLCFPLYAAAREVVKLYRPYLDALNLTYTQYIALMVFWEQKKCSVKELGKKLYLDSGTLTPVLKSLEQKGFVRRYRSVEDERVLLVEITDAGEKLKDAAADVPHQVGACVNLDTQDARTLYRLLYELLGGLK
ncbi:MAG: MarR family transcriptional regulator [Clostridia bacterium]|jgi:DNA-binding MarR family transcriptional regulator|nr:MarR family transcriptional regulator [Clostridia bacterium]MBQ1376319.1 MarR family transcriptional regulator [Clostridia bacterium]MBQ4248547.1 MarR family transcriptional regulator [Clostridia bacterium]